MARTTATKVQAVIETSLGTTVIEALIDDASLWVTEFLSSLEYSDARLEAIERYLACHFVTLKDPRLTSLKVGDLTEDYQRDGSVTEYLKAAIGWDPSGTVEEAFVTTGDQGRITFRVGTGFDS